MEVVAALFVDEQGCYSALGHVDLWDESRDARLYSGPHPVVAHPPCARWCRLAGLVEARYGYRRGEDGGCFASALQSVRKWRGVLEHPAYSDAWAAFELPRPPATGGWVRGDCGGYACHVEQGNYGHPARKATWLYAFGCDPLPELRWGRSDASAWVSWCDHARGRVRISKKAASATPIDFRDALLSIAQRAR
jgi:hypothetical protein